MLAIFLDVTTRNGQLAHILAMFGSVHCGGRHCPALSGGVQRCPAVSGAAQRYRRNEIIEIYETESHIKKTSASDLPGCCKVRGGCWGGLGGGGGLLGVAGRSGLVIQLQGLAY